MAKTPRKLKKARARHAKSCDGKQAYRGKKQAQEVAAKLRAERGRVRGSLALYLRTFRPSYTPHAIEFTDEMRSLSDRYTARAVRSF